MTTIKPRRDTAANWAAAEASSPALADGEFGYDSTNNNLVVGDGVSKVAELTSVGSGTYVPADPALTATYNPDGSVASVTEDGITTTYTYAAGRVATSTRLGVTRTYTYSGDQIVSVA